MQLQIAMPPPGLFLARCKAFPGLAYLTYLQICRTPNFVFALQSRTLKQDHLGCASTDEGILLVVVFVRGMRCVSIQSAVSSHFKTRSTYLQHFSQLDYKDVCVRILVC